MDFEEELWRTFQSKFAKLLNRLPKDEQRQYYQVFSWRNKLNSNFDFEHIRREFYKRIRQTNDKKRTKLLRKILGIKMTRQQKEDLKITAKIYAMEVFLNRDDIINYEPTMKDKISIGLKKVYKKCDFYPCPQ